MKASMRVLLLLLSSHMREAQEFSGLCTLVADMLRKQKLTYDQYERLRAFIRANRPQSGSKHFDKSCEGQPYYWPAGAIEPRRVWLNDMIIQEILKDKLSAN